jgi:hypothetical protein
MLILPYHQVQRYAFVCLLCFFLSSCVSDNYREQGDAANPADPASYKDKETKPMYKDLELQLSAKQSAWNGNSNLRAHAAIRSMKLIFDLDLAAFKTPMLPLSETKKDTFFETILNMEVLFNGQPILFDIPDTDKGWLLKTSMIKLPGREMDFESGPIYLNSSKNLQLSIPLFVLAACKSGSTGTVSVRVWQDVFIGRLKKKITKMEYGPELVDLYSDTLKAKLIDNTYTFSLTVPQIYRSDIVCDSIILQDDANWSPHGSDNTLWKSTYPDIYFSLSDLYDQPQSSSVTEKSTGKFTLGDTLSFYHYSPSEPFSITVYDYDVLSQDDVLGEWKGELSAFKNNASYALKFGHVKPFFIRKKEFGQVNK